MQQNSTGVNGLTMRWEEGGEGPAVVFLHGIPTSPRLWRHVVPLVTGTDSGPGGGAEGGARCLAWEMVGYGASIPEGHGRDISVARQAGYLVDWMDAVGLEQAVLVGHDLGGGVAQIAAVRHPERVRGLVLTNCIAYDSWPIPSVKAMRALGPALEHLPDAVFRPMYATFLRQGHDDRRRAEESIDAHWPYYEATGGAAAAFIRQTRSLDVRDTLAVADAIPRLDLPARLVWGAADPFQKIGYGYRLAYELDAPLDRIEGGLHFVPEDHPERIAAAVNDLLEQIERGG
jgi:pimeloyl-ACP methyl ester carboxylesterase